MKKKELTRFDLVDILWDNVLVWMARENSTKENSTWEDYFKYCFPKFSDRDYITGRFALENFIFEIKYLYKKPNRKTIDWLYGEHAFLYDVYGCREHRFICQTHNDYMGYIKGLALFCPECNKDAFKNCDSKENYIELIQGEFKSEEEWSSIIEFSKRHNRIKRNVDFKYRLKEMFNWNYIKYKIYKALLKLKLKLTKE